MMNNLILDCSNCRREFHQNSLQNISRGVLGRKSRKKYYNIGDYGSIFYLCDDCHSYMMEGNRPSSYWPSMIWKFLTHGTGGHPTKITRSIEERWALIPRSWRRCWINKISEINSSLTLDYPPPKFEEVTTDYHDFKQAVKELRWRSLSKLMDQHLCVPTIRCPWGCSEFLHLCKMVPLEDFLVHYSNRCLNGYSKVGRGKCWVSGIRATFPDTSCILECKDFMCKPSIVFDGQGVPQILCCKDHGVSCKDRYLHVPDSPTGTLYTPHSNQLAPAVMNSRTLRKVKFNSFNDTFATAFLQGGYDGIDSCYLTSGGWYTSTNALSDKRDMLSIAGRSDIRSHVLRLSSNRNARNYIPKVYVEDKM
jgi:hypothetical protein